MASQSYIELRGITKIFGTVVANDQVDLSVRKGEIHALLGENGSGKSTLVNMLSGIYSPDGGTITIDGKEQRFQSPRDAIRAGIGMVHQHFKLVEVFSAKENIVMNEGKGVFLKGKALSEEIYKIGKKYGLMINPDKKIYRMSVGEKQTVEILKVLYRGAKVLILDEPTAVLTPQETKTLFDILRNMKAEGCSVILITHKLGEVMEVSDRVTVLRKGRSIGTVETAKTDPRQLTEMMVGRPIDLKIDRPPVDPALKKRVLSVEHLSCVDGDGIRVVDDMSFTVDGGEILGVAGIAGSGQKELCEMIAGLQKASGGRVVFQGEDILGLGPRAIIKKGVSMSFIPEDRLGMGLVAGMDVVENVMLKSYDSTPGPFMDWEKGRELAAQIVEKYQVDTPSIYHPVKNLSGGNIQKVLLGREIDLNPALLITAYPVRGLDIGASYHIYDVLGQQKQKGVAVLYIGEDLDVLLSLCDRIMVIHHGRIMGIVEPHQVTKEDIGLMMLGHHPGEEEDHV